VPFLKLTRDRRGYEHTFLLHADTPGERPRVLYWYRTAPGVLIGRAALDEEAIRHIEEQHPLIEFEWPAILALREAMPPEDEDGAPRPERRERRSGRRDTGGRGGSRDGGGRDSGREQRGAGRQTPQRAPEPEMVAPTPEDAVAEQLDQPSVVSFFDTPVAAPTTRGLLEELVGREIATRLRARHAEIMARIHEQAFDASALAGWVARADALDPDTWLTPESVLAGVRDADAQFERLRQALLAGR
jgi:hypothetical protein